MSNRIASHQTIRTIGLWAAPCLLLIGGIIVMLVWIQQKGWDRERTQVSSREGALRPAEAVPPPPPAVAPVRVSEASRGEAGGPRPLTERRDALRVAFEELTTPVLERLDEVGSLSDRLRNQRLMVETARAALVEAENDLERAQLAVAEYQEGTFPHEMAEARRRVELAQFEVARAEERFRQTDNLHRQMAVSDDQHATASLWVQQTQLELRRAQAQLERLETYQKDRRIRELETDAARAETIRLTRKVAYEAEQAKVKQLGHQSAWMRTTDLDAPVVDRLREAAQLLDQLDSIAEADDDGEPLADQVQAHLDEAHRLWQRSEAQRARWRLDRRLGSE